MTILIFITVDLFYLLLNIKINGIILCVLLLLEMMLLRFIQIDMYACMYLFHLFYFWVIFHLLYISQFVIHSPTDKYLGYLQFRSVVNEAAKDIYVLFFNVSNHFSCSKPKSVLSGLIGVGLYELFKFYKVTAPFHTPASDA